MIEAIDKISYPAKNTYTGEGLDLVRTGLFEVSARPGVRDILIVMTDGASQVRSFDEKIFIIYSQIVITINQTVTSINTMN